MMGRRSSIGLAVLASARQPLYVGSMQSSQIGQTVGQAAPAYVIRYTYSFNSALEAGRFFQARLLRWYYLGFCAGLLVGAVVAVFYLSAGLGIVFFCAVMLLTTRFAVMDRLFGRRQARSLIGRTIELSLGDDGILWDGPLATARIPWTSITEVRANARTVLFVGDRLVLAFAPAHSFVTTDEQAEVVAYSRRQIAAAKADGRESIE